MLAVFLLWSHFSTALLISESAAGEPNPAAGEDMARSRNRNDGVQAQEEEADSRECVAPAGYQHHLGVWSLYSVTELTCYVQSVPLLKDPELPCLGSSGLP